jgi:hypothetical protein
MIRGASLSASITPDTQTRFSLSVFSGAPNFHLSSQRLQEAIRRAEIEASVNPIGNGRY